MRVQYAYVLMTLGMSSLNDGREYGQVPGSIQAARQDIV